MVKIAGYTITGVTKYKLEYDNPALKFLDKLVEKKGETRKRLITDIEYCIGKHAFTRPKPGDCDMHAIYPSKYNKYPSLSLRRFVQDEITQYRIQNRKLIPNKC